VSQQVTHVDIEDSALQAKPAPSDLNGRRTEKLVGKLERVLMRSGSPLADRFGEETAEVMRKEILDEYRRLVPQVPDIGGRRNIYSFDLEASAWFLAIYRVVVRHGASLEATGEVLHTIVGLELGRLPRIMRSILRQYRFSRLRMRKLEKAAQRSQVRRYPGDWVFEVVDGEGKPFDFGIDMTECGVLKFYHDQGADELVPYLCELDYLSAEIMGVGLQRTKTLAWGCDRCDFRMTKDGTTSAAWPPRFVERTCGQQKADAERSVG